MGNCTKIYLSVRYNHYASTETKTFNESLFVSSSMRETRPDTWPPVADGWAGADMRDFSLFSLC